MSIIGIVIALIVVGVVLYLVSLIPMDSRILRAIQAIVLLAVVLWIAVVFGVALPRGLRLR